MSRAKLLKRNRFNFHYNRDWVDVHVDMLANQIFLNASGGIVARGASNISDTRLWNVPWWTNGTKSRTVKKRMSTFPIDGLKKSLGVPFIDISRRTQPTGDRSTMRYPSRNWIMQQSNLPCPRRFDIATVRRSSKRIRTADFVQIFINPFGKLPEWKLINRKVRCSSLQFFLTQY